MNEIMFKVGVAAIVLATLGCLGFILWTVDNNTSTLFPVGPSGTETVSAVPSDKVCIGNVRWVLTGSGNNFKSHPLEKDGKQETC